MTPGLVSVMMPAYNAERFIAEAIESVLAQTYPQWELLVVNDGSRDATAEITARYTDDARVRLINKENGGEASARNVALENSQGEFIAYLDADDAWLPHHLQITVAHLQTYPEKDGVYTDGWHYTADGRRLKSLAARRRGPFEGDIFPELARASDVFGPPICVLLRHAPLAERRLRYDTRIVIGPDWEFFTRFAAAANFGYLPEQTCLYRVHQTNITVQVARQRRLSYLAQCRENVIQIPRFIELAVEVQTAVFYDLLINLTAGQIEKQQAILQWPQFQALPPYEQGRLLRLMASKSLIEYADAPHIAQWLHQARALAPTDRVAQLVILLYRLNPALCRRLLRWRTAKQTGGQPDSPFADLFA